MRKFVRILMFSLLGIAAIIGISLFVFSEKIPKTTPTKEGDELAEKMLVALNKEGWDSLHYLTWTFKGVHSYVWDKQNNLAIVTWDDQKVIINLEQVSGKAYKNDILVDGNEGKEMVDKAWSYWCNDSFWMFAPFKVFDPGTTRSVVSEENAAHGLMVKYESGGVTPGDSYLWLLDENYMPTGYKMWVKIIPIGGTYFSWENWTTLPSGAKVALSHMKGSFNLDMSNVKEAATLTELGYSEQVFDEVK